MSVRQTWKAISRQRRLHLWCIDVGPAQQQQQWQQQQQQQLTCAIACDVPALALAVHAVSLFRALVAAVAARGGICLQIDTPCATQVGRGRIRCAGDQQVAARGGRACKALGKGAYQQNASSFCDKMQAASGQGKHVLPVMPKHHCASAAGRSAKAANLARAPAREISCSFLHPLSKCMRSLSHAL